jgi:putative ABC transport system ATP-binding protein
MREGASSGNARAAEPIILCDGLVKIFKIQEVEVLALQGLELTVGRGELMGIVGPSGSGKSTLMNVLGGLVRPSAGRVIVDGHDLLKMPGAALNKYRREKVGFVWQQSSRNLVPYLTAVENVELPMILAGIGGRQTRRRADTLLERVGLAHRRHHYLAEMSGGEQQRVAVAVALANDPVILLADEPTGELDTASALAIYEMFRQLNRALGLTILIVSHDPTISRHVGRVMAIRDGKAASETRRRRGGEESRHGGPGEDHFEELVVLDSAGRLQVPKTYREALDIRGRVRMEMMEDGIVIRPVSREEQEELGGVSAESSPTKALRGSTWRRWWRRFRK